VPLPQRKYLQPQSEASNSGWGCCFLRAAGPNGRFVSTKAPQCLHFRFESRETLFMVSRPTPFVVGGKPFADFFDGDVVVKLLIASI
jgi:hypothetical protein